MLLSSLLLALVIAILLHGSSLLSGLQGISSCFKNENSQLRKRLQKPSVMQKNGRKPNLLVPPDARSHRPPDPQEPKSFADLLRLGRRNLKLRVSHGPSAMFGMRDFPLTVLLVRL